MGNCCCFYEDEVSSQNSQYTQCNEEISATSSSTSPNLTFYRNEGPASPNKEYIEEILQQWKGNYAQLERNHNFIQWLFPNRMPGVNPCASILTDQEAKEIRETTILRERVKRAFEMMLDFYGMELTSDNQCRRAENFEERLFALDRKHNHNFLRISRILYALKELGHTNLMRPWMKLLAELIYKEGKLETAKDSFDRYWINILNTEDRIFIDNYRNEFNPVN